MKSNSINTRRRNAMRTRTLIGAGLAVALGGAIWSYQSPASAQGWGMVGGYGPGYGHMGGWGGGNGPWNCPAFGQNDGQGYGPGYHMRGWRGGYGPGYDRGSGVQNNQALNLSTDDVKSRMERWLVLRGNPRLKLGEV